MRGSVQRVCFEAFQTSTGTIALTFVGLCSGLEGFWAALQQQTTLQTQMPLERWDTDALYDPDGASGHAYVRFAALAAVRCLLSSYCSRLASPAS